VGPEPPEHQHQEIPALELRPEVAVAAHRVLGPDNMVLLGIREIPAAVVVRQPLTGQERLHSNSLSRTQLAPAVVLLDKLHLAGANNENPVHLYNL
jgi:hypothetical protein